jgi:hypothetical protein
MAESSQLIQSCVNVNNDIAKDTAPGAISINNKSNSRQAEDVVKVLSGKYEFVANKDVIEEIERQETLM